MRGQYQRVRRQRFERRERAQEPRQWVPVRLDRPNGDVGRDLRQQHVTRYENARAFGVKRGMLWRMAKARNDVPCRRAGLEAIAGKQPLEARRRLRDAALVLVAS